MSVDRRDAAAEATDGGNSNPSSTECEGLLKLMEDKNDTNNGRGLNSFFTGRGKLLNWCYEANSGIYLVVGQQLIGKTALLEKIEKRDKCYIPERTPFWFERVLEKLITPLTWIWPQMRKRPRIRPLVVRALPQGILKEDALDSLIRKKAAGRWYLERVPYFGPVLHEWITDGLLKCRPSVLLLIDIDKDNTSDPNNKSAYNFSKSAYSFLDSQPYHCPLKTIFAGPPGFEKELGDDGILERIFADKKYINPMEPGDGKRAMEDALKKHKTVLKFEPPEAREAWLEFAEPPGFGVHLNFVLHAMFKVAHEGEGQLDEEALDKARKILDERCRCSDCKDRKKSSQGYENAKSSDESRSPSKPSAAQWDLSHDLKH